MNQNHLLIQVKDLIHETGRAKPLHIETPSQEKLGAGLAYIQNGTPLNITGQLEAGEDGILVRGEVSCQMTAQCGRCLDDYNKPLKVEFQEFFAYTLPKADEPSIRADEQIDLQATLRDAIVLALPFQPVCRTDCEGITFTTAEGETQNPVDPRWQALTRYKKD